MGTRVGFAALPRASFAPRAGACHASAATASGWAPLLGAASKDAKILPSLWSNLHRGPSSAAPSLTNWTGFMGFLPGILLSAPLYFSGGAKQGSETFQCLPQGFNIFFCLSQSSQMDMGMRSNEVLCKRCPHGIRGATRVYLPPPGWPANFLLHVPPGSFFSGRSPIWAGAWLACLGLHLVRRCARVNSQLLLFLLLSPLHCFFLCRGIPSARSSESTCPPSPLPCLGFSWGCVVRTDYQVATPSHLGSVPHPAMEAVG